MRARHFRYSTVSLGFRVLALGALVLVLTGAIPAGFARAADRFGPASANCGAPKDVEAALASATMVTMGSSGGPCSQGGCFPCIAGRDPMGIGQCTYCDSGTGGCGFWPYCEFLRGYHGHDCALSANGCLHCFDLDNDSCIFGAPYPPCCESALIGNYTNECF